MTSKIWSYTARGTPFKILTQTSRPVPHLSSSTNEEQLLLRVSHAGLNHGSLIQMALIPSWMRKSPSIPEMDLSATVVEVSSPSSSSGSLCKFSPGDKIAAHIPAAYGMKSGEGALAQHITIPAKFAVSKPDTVTFEDAAGGLVGGMVARQLLVDAGVKKGSRVLVNGASGGVGTMTIQMARNIVGEDGVVVGVCSQKNVKLVKDLGANEVVDYRQHADLASFLSEQYASEPFAAVIDTIGLQELYLSSAKYLTPRGVYAATGIKPASVTGGGFMKAVWTMQMNALWPLSPMLGGVGRKWRAVNMMDPTLEDRERVIGMLERGEIKVVKDGVRSFDEVKEAYEHLSSKRACGKILIKVDETAMSSVS